MEKGTLRGPGPVFVRDAPLAMPNSRRLSWSHCGGKRSDQQHGSNYNPSFDENKGFASKT